jgi:hypothetical protein
MIFIKTMTIDGFLSHDEARNLSAAVFDLNYTDYDFGKEIENFNLVAPDSSELFSKAFKMNLIVDEDRSGIFRFPKQFIHFESFDAVNEWMFVAALQESIFNVFEHKTGAASAIDGYKFNYRNLFEWDLMVSYILKPGQGILFRPWLFHSFDSGLIQVFRLREE